MQNVQCNLKWAKTQSFHGSFFCVQVIYVIVKIVTPCFNRPMAFLAGPSWDNVLEDAHMHATCIVTYKIFYMYFTNCIVL